ncbi:nitroreductase family protein [Treponema sp. OMZ 840]|uniref:nitroreductase family protein n=1 Tax=Treponema sp. OMZ 840 TaxID=244313 RepID=UPI003D8ECBE5
MQKKDNITLRVPEGIECDCGKDALSAIMTRKSIRRYTEQCIPDAYIQTLLYTGMCAPSAHNLRPYSFVVIKDKEKLKTIADKSTYAKMAAFCDVCIVVCGDTEIQKDNVRLIEDCAAVTQNILLAAHALGLGAVWCGAGKTCPWHDFLHNLLGLPESVSAMSLIPLGFPDEAGRSFERFESSKIHYERWSD